MPSILSKRKVAIQSFLGGYHCQKKKGKQAADEVSLFNNLETTKQFRDTEELEGTLINPQVISETAGYNSNRKNELNSSAATAVSSTFFEYTINIMEFDTIGTKEKDVSKFLTTSNEEPREKKQNRALQLAKRQGLIKADQEKEEINRANRKAYAINYHTSNRIQDAKQTAGKSSRRNKHYDARMIKNSDGIYNISRCGSIYEAIS